MLVRCERGVRRWPVSRGAGSPRRRHGDATAVTGCQRSAGDWPVTSSSGVQMSGLATEPDQHPVCRCWSAAGLLGPGPAGLATHPVGYCRPGAVHSSPPACPSGPTQHSVLPSPAQHLVQPVCWATASIRLPSPSQPSASSLLRHYCCLLSPPQPSPAQPSPSAGQQQLCRPPGAGALSESLRPANLGAGTAIHGVARGRSS